MEEEKGTDEATPVSVATAEASPGPVEKPAVPEAAEDWATRFKYLLADFENFRRRAAKERDALRRTVRADVIVSLLPMYEAADRARAAVARLPPSDPVRKGIELLAHEWASFLENEHVKPVAKTGEPFRPEWHEAVAEAPPRPGAPAGTVLEVVQQGYRLDLALLRAAKVVVARATPSPVAPRSASEAVSQSEAMDLD